MASDMTFDWHTWSLSKKYLRKNPQSSPEQVARYGVGLAETTIMHNEPIMRTVKAAMSDFYSYEGQEVSQ